MTGRRRKESWREKSWDYQAVEGTGRTGRNCMGDRLEDGGKRILCHGGNGGVADRARRWEGETLSQVEAVTKCCWDRGLRMD